jgi:putative chitinase
LSTILENIMSFEFDFRVDQVQKILHPNPQFAEWYTALCDQLPKYDITTVPRVAMFMAQTAHESGGYTALKENLNYQAHALTSIWPKRFPPDVAAQVAHNPEAIANIAYSNRMGNGSPESGDGWKFHGRGLIQLTGRTNYEKFARMIGRELDDTVAYCETPDGAVESACFFWKEENLNSHSDAGDVERVTRIINGGTLGIEDRTARFNHAVQVLQS